MLLVAKNLTKYFSHSGDFFSREERKILALDHVSFCLKKGETLGIAGESGSGKTTLARILCRIIPVSSGTLAYSPDITDPRKDIQMIFQNPYEVLDPKMTIGESLKEPLKIHRPLKNTDKILKGALSAVGLAENTLRRLPDQFSGGQRQRIVIARALLPEPKLLVCDEPTSSLDLSVQAQIVNLLTDFKEQFRMTMLFISHNLSLLRIICDRIIVLYSGIIVEQGPAEILAEKAAHPYTQLLLGKTRKRSCPGNGKTEIPAGRIRRGCPFHPLCGQAQDECEKRRPEDIFVGKGHSVACFYPSTR